MLYTSLQQLKIAMEMNPDDHSDDLRLAFINTWVSSWIEELLNRPNLSYAIRTEYYPGTGTQKLCLQSRPVYPAGTQAAFPLVPTPIDPIVVTNQRGYYNEAPNAFNDPPNTPLVYGQDFALMLDNQPDGSSRSGILVRIGNYWNRPWCRMQGRLSPFVGEAFGNIQVTYSGGFSYDTLPGTIQMAANLLAMKLRYLLPTGLEIGSESYEERSISVINSSKSYLLSTVRPMLYQYRNWKW